MLVVGLRGGQIENIRNAFGEHIQLSFVGSQEDEHRIYGAAQHIDAIVLMRNFISHQHSVVAAKTGKPVILMRGGMTRLKEAIESWMTSQQLLKSNE